MSNKALIQEKIDRVIDFAVSELGIDRAKVLGYLIQAFKIECRAREFQQLNLERKRIWVGFSNVGKAADVLGVSAFRLRRVESGKLADPVLFKQAEALYLRLFEGKK